MIKKLIVPVLITILLCFFFLFYVAVIFFTNCSLEAKLIGSIIPFSLACVSIYVLIERIQEIRSGEEDDLSKY